MLVGRCDTIAHITQVRSIRIGSDIQIKDDILYISGAINEFTELKPFYGQSHPEKISLRGVKSINSMGIHRFYEFASTWGSRKIQLVECSPVFLDAINTFPDLLGSPSDSKRVRSVILPFFCNQCGRSNDHLIDVWTIDSSNPESLPGPECCLQKMELDGLFEDFFLFLECND